ncbi:hypothetical protein HY78_01750 [Rhizorhabdus wittichii DC-6]|nr:hypothetical protein HY78_01750 [Rhizorhabdus wittichii DC-6]
MFTFYLRPKSRAPGGLALEPWSPGVKDRPRQGEMPQMIDRFRRGANIIGRTPAILALLLLTGAAPALADTFSAGQWEHRTVTVSAEVPGVPQWVIKMFAGNRTRRSCHSAAELAARPEALLTQDDAAVCKVRRFSMAGGKLVYDTFCTNKRFPEGLLVASKGSYTADGYAISTLSTGTKEGEPVRIETTGTGRRIGNCKK